MNRLKKVLLSSAILLSVATAYGEQLVIEEAGPPIVQESVVAKQQGVDDDKGKLQKYMRSSIATMMVYHPEDEFAPDIKDAFTVIPTPDKYNNHDLSIKSISYNNLRIKGRNKAGLFKERYGNVLKKREIRKNGEAIEDFVNRLGIAKILVAKWFNLQGDSLDSAFFNMELIHERGLYNATVLDAEIAARTVRGFRLLADAGEELIGNTYLLVNDMTYITAEQRAQAAKIAMAILGGVVNGLTGSDSGTDLYDASARIADSFTGFTVKNHSYLMRLVWNDSIASVFYNNYYTDKPDYGKIAAFLEDSTTFRMEYVAHEFESGSKTTLKGQYDRHDLIKIICTRSIDKNIAALQLQYEDFKVKTPVTEIIHDANGKITGYGAQIGLKEGVTEKTRFEVVDQRFNEETNQTEYKRVATLKPVKGKIWDNRYMAYEEHDQGSDLKYTTFKKISGGDIYPGMLIIEGKYRKSKK